MSYCTHAGLVVTRARCLACGPDDDWGMLSGDTSVLNTLGDNWCTPGEDPGSEVSSVCGLGESQGALACRPGDYWGTLCGDPSVQVLFIACGLGGHWGTLFGVWALWLLGRAVRRLHGLSYHLCAAAMHDATTQWSELSQVCCNSVGTSPALRCILY